MPSHARGKLSRAQIRRHYRHRVEIEMPWNGLGPVASRMSEWIAQRKIPHGTESSMDLLTYCFPDASIAGDFVAEFGGKLVTAPK